MNRTLRHTQSGKTPKSRTSNACEACKRRKTKCSGGPSPCEVCKRAETFCNFNPKLDTRRKLAYNSTTIQDRQQFMLTALLQTIKHSSEADLQHLISLVRGPSRPDAVATCLRKHFSSLQSRGIIPLYDIDHTDVISLGLQGLCGHRKGRARPKSPPSAAARSPPSMSADGRASTQDGDDDEMAQTSSGNGRSLSPFSIEDNEPFDPVDEYGTTAMFDADTPLDQDFHPMHNHDAFRPPVFHPEEPSPLSFMQAGNPSHPNIQSRGNDHDAVFTTHSSPLAISPHLVEAPEPYRSGQPRLSGQHFQNFIGSYHMLAPDNNYGMMHYNSALADRVPSTLDPNVALKAGPQAPFAHSGPSMGSTENIMNDFNHPQCAFRPLRSNA